MASAKNREDKIRDMLKEQKRYKLPEIYPLPGGVETLIDSEYRKELPDIPKLGRRCQLMDIISYTPETYEGFLSRIRSGEYINVSTACVGLSYGTVLDWAGKGRKDLEKGEDTYYSRFVKDVLRAIAQCRGSVEESLSQIDPKKWLSLGPGKLLGNDWSDTETTNREVIEFLGEDEKKDASEIPMKVLELDEETVKSVEAELIKAKITEN
jgi:hypothetical protein